MYFTTNTTVRLVLLSLSIVTLFVAASRPAGAQTFIELSAGPRYPSPVLGALVKGETAVPLEYAIVNNSDGPIVIDTIEYVPACDSSAFASCTGAAVESNVFSNFSMGTGASGTACAGMTFTFGAPVGGVIPITFTGTLTIPTGGDCIIDFTANVTGIPVNDVDSAFPGVQTFGTGFASANGAVTTLLTGSGTGSSEVTIDSCEIKLDKQISCDGGTTWQDVTGLGAPGEGAAADSTDTLTQGCVAKLGASVEVRYVLSNALPTAAPVSCTSFSDSVTGPISASFPIAPQAASTPVVITSSPFACTVASSGSDTATLSTCTCSGLNGLSGTAQTVAVDSGSLLTDTATHFCAGVTVDKQVSCNSGTTFVDIGQETANGDGTNGCAGTAGVSSIEAQWFAQNQGTIPLTCNLSESNANFPTTGASGISLFPGSTSPVAIGGGPTAPKECLAALDIHGVAQEPDTATLACAVNLIGTSGIVDRTGGLSVFDSATFTCSTPGFQAQKTCTLASGDTFNVGVTVTNTDSSGGSTLSCTIVDQTFPGSTCGAPGAGTAGPVIMPGTTADPLAVAASSSSCNPSTGVGCTSSTGTGTLTTSTELCNQATVTCTANGLALPVQNATADCVPPAGGIKLKKVFSADSVLPGDPVMVTFTIINQGATVLTGLAFTDTFPADMTSTGLISNSCGGSATIAGDVLTFSGGAATLAPGASCSIVVGLTADLGVTTPLRVCDTTSPVTSTTITSPPAYACITIGSAAIAPTDSYQLNYASNLSIGDSVVNLTNSGALNGLDPAGNICVNVYTMDAAEEMISCCSCLVTPNALDSLSVLNDLVADRLTAPFPGEVVIKLLANAPDPGLCNASSPNFQNLTPGLLAWGTKLHQNPAALGTYRVTESPFQKATLSASELTKLSSYCGFIQSVGSGYGICNSCSVGGLGAVKK